MRICILSDEYFPHTGADTQVIIHTAAALGEAGAEVVLAVPWLWWRHRTQKEVCDYYGVQPRFELARLPSWPPPERTLRLAKIGHGLLGPIYSLLRGCDLVHSRDLLPLVVAHGLGFPWSFETYRRHVEEKPWLPSLTHRLHLERAVGAIAHSPAAAEDLLKVGFPPDAVQVARPGCAATLFEPRLTKAQARRRLGLATDRPIVGYMGNVGVSKGTEELLQLARRMPEVTFLVVGGGREQIAALRAELIQRRLGNVLLLGHQPPARVAAYLFAVDVLYSPQIQRNVFAGSVSELLPLNILPGTPLKLYSYLASGRPIVSADQPHTRDLLQHEVNAVLVAPGDIPAAAASIRKVLEDPKLARRLAAAALRRSRRYTVRARGEAMLAFFDRRLAARRGA